MLDELPLDPGMTSQLRGMGPLQHLGVSVIGDEEMIRWTPHLLRLAKLPLPRFESPAEQE